MRLTAVILLMVVLIANCYPVERTEAQRYYDLGVSYIKSDLYEDGLKTLNQVAFLYPDSDVADDALYQLALIREQVGNGEITIGEAKSLRAMETELGRLTGSTTRYGRLADILTMINAHLKGEQVLSWAKEEAISQYLLALDYLNTLQQRYPNSDILEESKLAFTRVTAKIESLMPMAKPVRQSNSKGDLVTIGLIVGGTISVLVLLAILDKYSIFD